MFVFSELHPWQNETAVMQVLVFSSHEMQVAFQQAYSIATQKHDPKLVEGVSDSNMGAIYKLRAVLNSDGMYIPTIRCGFTGLLLKEFPPEITVEECILRCKIHLKNSIDVSLFA